jgi:hypothetical protein
VDLQSNPDNCGTCGNACAFGAICSAGTCVLPAYGSGADGALNASGSTVQIDTTLSPVSGSAGTTQIHLGAPTGFAAGKVIFLHQSQGTGAGAWELNLIASISGGNAITAFPLAHTYAPDASSPAQAVVVPQYTTVNIPAGTQVSAPKWNGAVGGILVFQAQTSVQVSGSIVMDAAGFRGGPSTTSTNQRGESGESSVGTFLTGAKSNNGEGGGGGGACNPSVGGSGGHATAAGASNASLGCYGTGGTASGDTSDLSLMLFGGGGGGAGASTYVPSSLPGGGGGGIVYLTTPALNVTGKVSANGGMWQGSDIPAGTGCTYNGLSGSGAGGSIYLSATSGALSGITATGYASSGTRNCGTGNWVVNGNGGAGRIHLTGGITGTTSPAAQ